jgi:hypothetical protein
MKKRTDQSNWKNQRKAGDRERKQKARVEKKVVRHGNRRQAQTGEIKKAACQNRNERPVDEKWKTQQ